MDDNDAGAVFALAYGYALGKPVYAYCGILPNGRISLMVDKAATAVLDGPADLESLLDSGRVSRWASRPALRVEGAGLWPAPSMSNVH